MNRDKNDILLDSVRQKVVPLLESDDSGHSMDHVDRVLSMSMGFSDVLPDSNPRTVGLIALLHDVDDYKLVGREQSETLQGATNIMNEVGIDTSEQEVVKHAIANMGYSKSLKGIRPTSLEGMIVSDADMCDAIGASGIVRCLTYALSSRGSGVVFNPKVWPNIDITHEQYNKSGNTHDTDSFINHFFEKLLKLKGMMLTEPGREEASQRHDLMVDFLRGYFTEQGAQDWVAFLGTYERHY